MDCRLKLLCLCLSIILYTSCTVGPVYDPPSVETPQDWKNTNVKNPSPPSLSYADYWWEIFDDSTLNSLEQEALANNYDLKIAFNRVQEARALMDGAKAALYPHLYLNPSYSNQGVLYESYSTGTIVRSHQVLYLLPLNLSYEVDLWGKIRSRYLAARANWEAYAEAYDWIMLLLTTDLAAVYYQIRATDAKIAILESTIKNRKNSLQINQSRYDFKQINYSDVARAALEVKNAEAESVEATRLRALLENRLAVLLGNNPTTFVLEPSPLQGTPPEIPTGIPSEVLKRRPDISEAERQMASKHALINAAYANFFPSLSLTGVLGYSSPHLRFFLKNYSRWWGFGGDSSQMIFDGGELSAELAFQTYRFNEASYEYQEKVLHCFEEVENALSDIEKYREEFDDVSEAVLFAKKTLKISNNRYNSGVSSYLDVVISERDELFNEISQNDLLGLRFVSTIQLIKALGGGWERCDVDH